MANKKGSATAVRNILVTIVALLVLLIGGGGFYYVNIVQSPQPRTDGDLQVKGLNDKVEIIRDSYGIPHIYAKTIHDVFFAQGYAQAQDRWWQMEFFRKAAGGRIEELTGKKTSLVNADIYLRSLGFYSICKEEYDLYTPDQRIPLDAFAEGVNAYISGRSPDQLSVNYTILALTGVKSKIDLWSPLDTLAFAKIMARDQGLSRDTEIVRSKLYSLLGSEMAEEYLVPAWPNGLKPTIMQSEDMQTFGQAANGGVSLNSVDKPDTSFASNIVSEHPAPDLTDIFGETEGTGSNGWVASGGMTQSGKPLLANDPHMGIQMPSIWYEIALHCPDNGRGRPLDVAGFAFAACPGVIIGHNNDIAWGTTNVYPDVNDQYMMKINPDNPLQYEWNGKWRDMTVQDETINFGDGKAAVTIKVRQTHLGPIINENKFDLQTGEMQGFNNKDPLALHWTALEPSNLVHAIIGLDKAGNWDDFRAALKNWDIASTNVIYADIQGNIGYQLAGRIPIRPKGLTGQVPTQGLGDEYVWKGYIPYDLLPRIYNPERNFIVASNQECAPPEYYNFLQKQLGADTNPNFGSKYNKWNYGYRAQREWDMLKQLSPNSISTYQSIQIDNRYLSADEVLPYLSKLNFVDKEVTDARDWLMTWDKVCNEDSPYTALYAEFWMRVMINTFQNKLGTVMKAEGNDKDMWAINLLLQKSDSKWWDDPATSSIVETRDDVLVRSFSEGYAATVMALGKDRTKWKWGLLHAANFISNPLGASGIGPIEVIVNKSKVPVGGNSECVNSQMWMGSTGTFVPISIPAMRMIVDMSDLTKCIGMNSTGQSGHPGSPWYGDMIELWRNNKYHPMLWTRQQVDSGAVHRLNLGP